MTVSEATLTWEHWRARRRRRRVLKAWSGSVGLAVLVVALGFLGFLPVFHVGEKGEALLVKLGNPDGEDLPLSVSAVPDQAMQAVMTAQRVAAANTVEETRASTDQTPDAVPVAPPKKPVAPAKPANPAEKPVPTPPVEAKVPAPTVTEKVIRGSEKGNSSELVLKPQGDKISQNAYWPVYLFMPLPAKLDAGLLARVKGNELYDADERRQVLLQFYSKAELSLIADPGLPVRPAIWQILEDAGYDVANADYKRGKSLNAVIIGFKLAIPTGPAVNPELTEVKLEQSSGNVAVDAAVLYAFKQSTFANGTGQVAQGRYTYDFASRK